MDIPPVERSKRSDFLDEEILQISENLFENHLFGYGVGIILNVFYLYYWYKRATIFSLVNFLVLYYIIIKIIQIKILGW